MFRPQPNFGGIMRVFASSHDNPQGNALDPAAPKFRGEIRRGVAVGRQGAKRSPIVKDVA
jgi:hypothetical protein